MPSMGSSPKPGLSPETPQKEAGLTIEPPVCVPSAARHISVATAAALPLEEPPGVWLRFHGLRVGGGSKQAHSVVTVLPSRIAPAFLSDLTIAASRAAICPSRSGEPHFVGQPVTSMMS